MKFYQVGTAIKAVNQARTSRGYFVVNKYGNEFAPDDEVTLEMLLVANVFKGRAVFTSNKEALAVARAWHGKEAKKLMPCARSVELPAVLRAIPTRYGSGA